MRQRGAPSKSAQRLAASTISVAAAPIAKAEGEHQPIDIFLLNTILLPADDQVAGLKIRVVLLEGMRQHPASVHAFPPENVIRESLAFGG